MRIRVYSESVRPLGGIATLRESSTDFNNSNPSALCDVVRQCLQEGLYAERLRSRLKPLRKGMRLRSSMNQSSNNQTRGMGLNPQPKRLRVNQNSACSQRSCRSSRGQSTKRERATSHQRSSQSTGEDTTKNYRSGSARLRTASHWLRPDSVLTRSAFAGLPRN